MPDRVVVALGDVSGKGIPAALFMGVTLTLRTMARLYEDPAEILTRLNDELAEQNPRGMFVTIQCAVFDLRRAASPSLAPGTIVRWCSPPEMRPA